MNRSYSAGRGWLLPLLALALMLGILIGRSTSAGAYAFTALLVSVVAACLGRGRLRIVGCMLVSLSLGCMVSWQAYHPTLPAEGDHCITGVVTEEISLREDGQVQTILDHVMVDGESWHARAYWTYYLDEGEALPEMLLPGAQVSFSARLYHPSGEDNPGGFDFREYLLQRGVTFGIYGAEELSFSEGSFTLFGSLAALRHDLTLRLMDVMGPEAGAYAAAMLLGSRDFIPDEDNEAFRGLGIAHILSVSGYHVGVLAGLLMLLMRPLHLHRAVRMVIEGAVLLAYSLLTGAAAPVIRAALLFLLMEWGRLRLKQNLPLHLLCLSAGIQLLANPTLLTSASFQLTYGAMLGITVIRPRLVQLHSFRHFRANQLWEALCAGIAAQLGILPAQLYWFGELPLLSLLLNLLVMTLTSGVMALYWLTLALLPAPGLRELLGTVSAGLTRLLLSGVRWLGRIEGTTLWTRQADLPFMLGWLLLMVGLSVFLPARQKRLRRALVLVGTVLTVCILLPIPHFGTTYTQFSVGEADAALLRDEDMVIVIDAGEDDQVLAEYLHQRRLSVDLLILTHLHSDHAGGVQAMLDAGIPIRRCALPVGAEDASVDEGMLPLLEKLSASGTEIVHLTRGDVIPLPSGSLTVVWPQGELLSPGQDANDSSLTLLAELHGTTMLLTGDLTGTYEGYAAIPADILKAAHHGSAESTSPAFLDTVSPQVVLLSCGTEARRESLLARTGSLPLYDTNRQGAVTIRFDDHAFHISTYLSSE